MLIDIISHSYMSFLPLFGVQILLYKIFSHNRDFSSSLFVLFGFCAYLFFSSESIVLTFLLWELMTWFAYYLLRTENNLEDVRTILLSNVIGGLALAWAVCILSQKFYLWSDVDYHSFSNIELIQIVLGLSIAILTKSSQFPFTWLMLTRKSSSLISAYLHSSTVVQMGVYLLLKSGSIVSNELFLSILTLSSFVTVMYSCFYFGSDNFKILVALASQIHVSLCILFAIYDPICLKMIVFVHAIYKSFMFIYCDEVYKLTKSYNIKGINYISCSALVLLILCAIPMCAIPGFIYGAIYGSKVFAQNIYNNLLILFVKSLNIIIFARLFYRLVSVISDINYFPHRLDRLHGLFIPCLLFLLPSGQFKLNYFIVSCCVSYIFYFLLHRFNLNIHRNLNVVDFMRFILRNIRIPSGRDNIFYASCLFLILVLYALFQYDLRILIGRIYANLCIHSNVEEMIFYTLLLIGCSFLLQDGLYKKLSGFWLISICITNEYIKFGGVDIVITNILVDIIVSYLLIKSAINFDSNHTLKSFLKYFPLSILIAFLCVACFKVSEHIVHYDSSVAVNDIVVFYRVLDTLGEILVIFLVGLCINKKLIKK